MDAREESSKLNCICTGPVARVVIAGVNDTRALPVTQLGTPLNLTLGLAPSRVLWPPSDATSLSSSRLLNCSRGWRRTFEITCQYALEASAATAKVLHVCNGSATVSIDGAKLCPLRRTCASWNVTRQVCDTSRFTETGVPACLIER